MLKNSINKGSDKNSATESILLEGLLKRDKAITEEIYRQHYGTIRALILSNNGSEEDAADIFQEAMIVLFEKVQAGDFELHCRLGTFLYSVARNLWLKKLQQNKRFLLKTEDLEEIVSVEDDLLKHEQRQQQFDLMAKALSKLGEPCKSLITAFYLLKKPMHRIAEEFGYTNADNAKTQKYKCLVRLKKLFFADYKIT